MKRMIIIKGNDKKSFIKYFNSLVKKNEKDKEIREKASKLFSKIII